MSGHAVMLTDICNIQYGFAFDSKQFSASGKTPLVRIRDVVRGFSETYTNEDFTSNYQVHDGDILVGMDGEFNVARWHGGEAALNQRVCKLIPSDKIDGQYLFYSMIRKLKRIEERTAFVTVKHLSAKELNKISLTLPTLQVQKNIAEKLDTISRIISYKEKSIHLLDALIKSRFIEMFGDPVTNPHGWDKVPLSNLAEIKIGPFGTLLHKEDYITGGHALVNPSHIHDGNIVTDGKLTITDEKYAELSAYHLSENDVVMGRRGEMGRCAVVKESGLLCGTGSMIIRSYGEVRADFLQKIISFPSFKKTIEDMAVGQTMPNLNVPIVSRLEIIKPPTKVQDDYYAFVELTDKSK
ncbi:MAG TPA: type I restriction endonuclease subunit R, partial [Selenomonas sp.]|nr:type I restriction endonuclease subunit R [Selenomonas sp.]